MSAKELVKAEKAAAKEAEKAEKAAAKEAAKAAKAAAKEAAKAAKAAAPKRPVGRPRKSTASVSSTPVLEPLIPEPAMSDIAAEVAELRTRLAAQTAAFTALTQKFDAIRELLA